MHFNPVLTGCVAAWTCHSCGGVGVAGFTAARGPLPACTCLAASTFVVMWLSTNPCMFCAHPLQELGVTILQDLARQRETITHARDTLHGADDNISKARKVRL
eukprot:GHRQ01036061.1.p1 GENE.GHRQ01036061.1~~GHRQ01036061.1.p1  ORF type:complete len:103 (+),score=20.96 GHRQ01036061.1:55-363(+)